MIRHFSDCSFLQFPSGNYYNQGYGGMYGNQYGNQYNRNAGYGNYYNNGYGGYGTLNSYFSLEMQERRQAFQELPRTFSFYRILLMFVNSKLVSDISSLLFSYS